MNKEKYERTEIEIFQFQTEDVITTSGPLTMTIRNMKLRKFRVIKAMVIL